MASMLEHICHQNADMRAVSPTMFDAVSIPAMSLHCYLVRMRRYTKFDFSCFFVAISYIERLCKQNVSLCPTMHNIHRLIVTAILVASKATDGAQPFVRISYDFDSSYESLVLCADIFHTNLFIAQCGGINVIELNRLEAELCDLLCWRLIPTAHELHSLSTSLENVTSSYWDSWLNIRIGGEALISVPKLTVECVDTPAPCKSVTREHSNRGMPHAKSWQDHLGRLLFGPTSAEPNDRLSQKVPAFGEEPKLTRSDSRGSYASQGSGSPGSPRSVFRRMFSEQILSFAS